MYRYLSVWPIPVDGFNSGKYDKTCWREWWWQQQWWVVASNNKMMGPWLLGVHWESSWVWDCGGERERSLVEPVSLLISPLTFHLSSSTPPSRRVPRPCKQTIASSSANQWSLHYLALGHFLFFVVHYSFLIYFFDISHECDDGHYTVSLELGCSGTSGSTSTGDGVG